MPKAPSTNACIIQLANVVFTSSIVTKPGACCDHNVVLLCSRNGYYQSRLLLDKQNYTTKQITSLSLLGSYDSCIILASSE